ncbi:NAAT family transporter [Trichocoleus desertorum AS-A10]|uniref:MarC family protein n=1 Tax=Trichocoleus desertorum TaxID=1481672 RepID=UPI003299038A
MQQLLAEVTATFLALLPIANPIGAVPLFYSLTALDSKAYRQAQARKTSLNVICVLVIFFLAGRLILEFFDLSLGVLRIAGGLLIAHTAWEMVTVRPRLTPPEREEVAEKEDISFTPMAVPMLSGPGAIGVVMGLSARSSQWLDHVGALIAILLLGAMIYFCLSVGDRVMARLGKSGVGAFNRVLGFFILAIAVQFIAEGTIALLKDSLPELFN